MVYLKPPLLIYHRLVTLAVFVIFVFNTLQKASESQDRWHNLKPGLEYKITHLTLENKARKLEVTLHVLRIDPNKYRLKLLSSRLIGGKPADTIENLVKKSDALAAVNASYFDEHYQPLGYLKDRSHTLVKWIATGSAFTGVFRLQGGKCFIESREKFKTSYRQQPNDDFIIQAGPRLINQKQITSQVHAGGRYRRTGIAIDKQNRIILYVTDPATPTTLKELQELLALPKSQGGLNLVDALNLDGGSSSQMCILTDQTHLVIPGFSLIPVAIGIVPK